MKSNARQLPPTAPARQEEHSREEKRRAGGSLPHLPLCFAPPLALPPPALICLTDCCSRLSLCPLQQASTAGRERVSLSLTCPQWHYHCPSAATRRHRRPTHTLQERRSHSRYQQQKAGGMFFSWPPPSNAHRAPEFSAIALSNQINALSCAIDCHS